MIVRESGSWEPQQTLAEVQANTPWEDHGVAGDPAFFDYDPGDRAMDDGSWPDFHLTSASTNAIDRGTTQLPASLVALLDGFDVGDTTWGTALDIGRYEAGFAVIPAPATHAIEAGGTAHYVLALHPPDLPHAVTLTLSTPPSGLSCTLSSDVITPGLAVTLTVAHDGSPVGLGAWHTVSITGDGGDFMRVADVGLLVGGERLYLPATFKDD